MAWLKRWWPVLVWAAVISTFSTGAFTSENTSRIIVPVLHWLFPGASQHTLFQMHHVIRKCGHFVEYFILSWLLLRSIRGPNRGIKLAWALVAIGLVACYASLDEFHQMFVPGRGPAVADVLLDTTGGIAAQAIAALVMMWAHLREARREKPAQNEREL
ncbi:MAG TPA: VanZ family protein [Candidatus Acidoferrum sp.]|nr:VanZ family protein [Candidatus Acidoferrum sp.]